MSKYLLLEDHYINGQYLLAGTTQSTLDVGGLLPTGWIPTPNVDPLDTAAVAAFYAVGPVQAGLVYVKPTTYWTRLLFIDFSPADFNPIDFATADSNNPWGLTGLGSNLPPINI